MPIGPITLNYTQGGIWLTPDEISQIPMNNASWDSLVTWSKKTMNIVADITCTAGGDCSTDSQTTRAMFARSIVGLRTNNSTMIAQVKSELDKVEAAINNAINVKHSKDNKWAERNLALLAVSANIVDYRPASLTRSLHKALYEYNFGESSSVATLALKQLPNRPAWGRWSLMTYSYIAEDFAVVNECVKAHAKAVGEKNWEGIPNDHKFTLTGEGSRDNWQTLQPGGKTNPLACMPAGIYYQTHGVGGLWLADQYRAANGPQWPPSFTDYTWESMASYNAVMWAANHLGFSDVFALGDYAMLRAYVFAVSTHDGKTAWKPTGNDTWQTSALMAWAKPVFSTLPDNLKPEPNASTGYPYTPSPGGNPGRGMGFMYATHYARLIK